MNFVQAFILIGLNQVVTMILVERVMERHNASESLRISVRKILSTLTAILFVVCIIGWFVLS